jgi:predicted nucleic acid-binding protein
VPASPRNLKKMLPDLAELASALEADCAILYTEDLHHGQLIKRLRIENPFLG